MKAILVGLALFVVCAAITYADYASGGVIFGPLQQGE